MSHAIKIKVDYEIDTPARPINHEIIPILDKMNLKWFGIIPFGRDVGVRFDQENHTFEVDFEMHTGTYERGVQMARAALNMVMTQAVDQGIILDYFTVDQHPEPEPEYALGV